MVVKCDTIIAMEVIENRPDYKRNTDCGVPNSYGLMLYVVR